MSVEVDGEGAWAVLLQVSEAGLAWRVFGELASSAAFTIPLQTFGKASFSQSPRDGPNSGRTGSQFLKRDLSSSRVQEASEHPSWLLRPSPLVLVLCFHFCM